MVRDGLFVESVDRSFVFSVNLGGGGGRGDDEW